MKKIQNKQEIKAAEIYEQRRKRRQSKKGQSHQELALIINDEPALKELVQSQKHEPKLTAYIFYLDPGHGWLSVPRQELIDLHIDHLISTYSYQKDKLVYLEEDSDMPTFLKAKGQANAEIIEKVSNSDSIIRSYEPYNSINKKEQS